MIDLLDVDAATGTGRVAEEFADGQSAVDGGDGIPAGCSRLLGAGGIGGVERSGTGLSLDRHVLPRSISGAFEFDSGDGVGAVIDICWAT